jgi:hypothetical protein
VTGAERRVHRRFDLSLPVVVRVKAHQVETATKDISARGIYFRIAGDVSLGTELECEVTLPPELCQGNTIQVRCRGKIVRVEHHDEDQMLGVAATIDDYEFMKTD